MSEQLGGAINNPVGAKWETGTNSTNREEEKRLTPRQLEVVYLLSIDRSLKQIALHMGISIRTVHAHILNAKKKTGKATQTGIVGMAIRKGIL
ncbi:MAG: LuxR C-terminal-related transcriptional regulator [Anaerolineaceae bacterium]|nr:LuxR C-terminal-related transcriptional regulator [Anaerolineaceae bacterium]